MKSVIFVLLLFLVSCKGRKTAIVNRQLQIQSELLDVRNQMDDKKQKAQLSSDQYKLWFDSLLSVQMHLMKEDDSLETELKKY